jgi:hypothetical protein
MTVLALGRLTELDAALKDGSNRKAGTEAKMIRAGFKPTIAKSRLTLRGRHWVDMVAVRVIGKMVL